MTRRIGVKTGFAFCDVNRAIETALAARTTWAARGADSVSIADATTGRSVAVEGQLQADGSIVATRVILG